MLAQRVWRLVDRRAVFTPGDRVVVAVSGGPDSLALLALLREQVGPRLGLQLHVAHFDHGWRAESGTDARWVAGLAERWGLPVTVGQAPIDLAQTEAAARQARYAFLRATAGAIDSPIIALGHTLDDQAETLMLHLLRGSGTHGLAAMRPRDGDLARPLLTSTRQEVEAFLREHQLEPLHDTSNDDPRFQRNRLRQTVMRALDDFDPAARRALARAADILAEEDAYLGQEAAALDEQRATIETLPPALQRRILVRRHPDVSFAEIEVMREEGEQTLGLKPQAWQVMAHPCACDPNTFRARDPIGHVDPATLALPLTVGRRQPGDRVQPLGQTQAKRLQDLLVDAHVPRHLRDHLPIVRDQRGIVWIPGVTVSHGHRVRADTPQPYHLEVQPQPNSNAPVTDS